MNKFNWLKKRFNIKNVDLYIISSEKEVNAYAIGGVRKQYISLTSGLIHEIGRKSSNDDQYVKALSAIIAHELSHINNKDYLPGLLAFSNRLLEN